MTFNNLPAGATVFLDANTVVYAVVGHPVFGAACKVLLDRVEKQDVQGVSSSHVLSEIVHRLMTVEACDRFGWPAQGIANRLRRHPNEVQSGDALIIAIMRNHSLDHLASNDGDFDRVPGITRYAPV